MKRNLAQLRAISYSYSARNSEMRGKEIFDLKVELLYKYSGYKTTYGFLKAVKRNDKKLYNKVNKAVKLYLEKINASNDKVYVNAKLEQLYKVEGQLYAYGIKVGAIVEASEKGNEIKDGMFIRLKNNNIYVKCGAAFYRVDFSDFQGVDIIDKNNIRTIYGSNGDIVYKKESKK